MNHAPAALPEQLLAIVQTRDEANAVCRGLLGDDHTLVGPLSLRTPRLEPPELAFMKVVAWLYVQYHEAGAVGIRFLAGLFDAYRLDPSRMLRAHIERTGRLRTYFQHNLDPSSDTDASTQSTCEDWFESVCGSRTPGLEQHWRACLSADVNEARLLFIELLHAVRAVEQDEAREAITEQWRTRLTRHHPPHTFDAIVSAAAADMGRDYLDAVKFRRRHYDKWAEALRGLDGPYEFDREARRLVEHALLSDATAALPITGSDVMRELGVEPGRHVGELLGLARSLFEADPCDSSTLLRRLNAAADQLL